MKDGIYTDLTIKEYHSNKTHVSATGAKHAKKCLRDFYYYNQGKYQKENVHHFDIGNAFELALLDKEGFAENVAIYNEDERPEPDKTFGTKANKEWKDNFYLINRGKYIISKNDYAQIEVMLSACYENAVINKLIQNIEYQYSCFWTCPETGLKFKTRPDIARVNKSVLVDVKTSKDGSPEKFRKDAANLDYFLQCITQIEGVQQTGLIKEVEEYYYLVVEKDYPYCAELYQVPRTEWGFMRDEMIYLFQKIKKAQDINFWPGYSDRADNPYGVLELTPPSWYSIYNV